MAPLATLGRVHLQYGVPNVVAGHTLPRRLRPGPPTIHSYEPGETRVAVVAKNMVERDAFLADARYRLE